MAINITGYQQKSMEARGLRFGYLEWGDSSAPAMVLLHGLTSHGHSWDVFVGALEGSYHVFALDQRGHGDTQWPTPPSYTTEDFIEDVASLTDQWGLRSFVLMGLSMGAHNSLAFAAKYPDKVEKLISIDIGPQLRLRGEDGQQQQVPKPQTEFDSIKAMITQAREGNSIASDEMLRHRVEHNARQLPGGKWTFKYTQDTKLYWQPEDLWEKIKTIRCPTLVVRGGESSVLAADVAEKMTAAIPNARLVTIAGSGHPVPLDRPQELESAVRQFLDS